MLRSVLIVAASVCDVSFVLHHALSPKVAAWAAASALVATAAGCVLTAAALSRTLAGLDLPAARRR